MIFPRAPHSDNAFPPVVASASGLLKHASGSVGVLLAGIRDCRDPARVDVPTSVVLRSVLMGFLLGLGSIRAIEDRVRRSVGFRKVAGAERAFTDDTVRDVLTRVSHEGLSLALYATAKRELLHWGAGRFRESALAARLKPLNCSMLAARAVVAIDGHETFCSEKVSCEHCHTRVKKAKRGGVVIEVDERYHKLVVAHRIGTHPAVILDAEPIVPPEGEVTAAYRLVERLGKLYGAAVGIVVADAAYDSELFRTKAQKAGFRYVMRHKDGRREPGGTLAATLQRRDPDRKTPDGWHKDPANGCKYAYWCEQESHQGRRYVEVRRTDPKGHVQTGGLVTDLPSENIPAMAAVILMETRWWIENTAFHELAGQLSFDRAYVHKDRASGAWAVALLALLAYNVWQSYLYRNLGLDPKRPGRTWADLRRDIFESLHKLTRPTSRTAWARPP